jgi:hypothetical protein
MPRRTPYRHLGLAQPLGERAVLEITQGLPVLLVTITE